MTEKNIACTGTIRLILLGDCPGNAEDEMQKTARATFDVDTSCNQLCWTILQALVSALQVKLAIDIDWFQIEQKEPWKEKKKKKKKIKQGLGYLPVNKADLVQSSNSLISEK